ncbi:N-acetylmuramic acid 6-phosphate etherase [Dactylosporangium sp. NPDC051484]|uniref:N-acetylmuramic acid 6-phosphate etherase n=1 Tax=Dactylosporangium sp. NPDC051484 TaxID=3154942 RepID=UPI00344ECD0A
MSGVAPGDPVFVRSPTELRDPATVDLDLLDTPELLARIHAADATVPGAVAAALPDLALAVDLTVAALRRGGRVHYAGAGSSGRLAVLDAAEIPPTFGVPPDRFVAHIAGGDAALRAALEAVEDDAGRARAELAAAIAAGDVLVGLAASGRTPYLAGAFAAAAAAGAATVLVTSNPAAPLAAGRDVCVVVDTGPEVITGSTRMKAGTAQKLVLHTFSTAVLVRLGHTYSNLMVDLRATNAKLRGRTLAILAEATGAAPQACAAALSAAGGELKTALVTLLAGTGPGEARAALAAADGHTRAALAALSRQT